MGAGVVVLGGYLYMECSPANKFVIELEALHIF